MRLKHLVLHGFKTFAPKTDLVFGEGLTAIVGPNGSGKSNVADAVRWVLGEQSFSNLRAKRTEDLIFAGSSNRPPLGMAEVSITIDNSDRLLPLEFGEVTITRRAFRSGENEYFINKSRVRMRDVLDVASTLGQAYTVVGQGLIDAALSLRPEERRELFEEAAAIRGYFMQREDALRRLTRTEENMARVNDLASELEPQVRRLERQAKQAQDYNRVEAELRELLAAWYAGRYQLATRALSAAQQDEQSAHAAVHDRRAQVDSSAEHLAAMRARVWQMVAAVSALHEQRAQGQARHAAEAQAQAVARERLAAAAQAVEALAAERAALDDSFGAATARRSELLAEAERLAAEIAGVEAGGREAAGSLTAFEAKLRDAERAAAAESAKLDATLRRVSDLQRRAGDAEREQAEREGAVRESEAQVSTLRERLLGAEAQLSARHEAQSAAQRRASEAERQQASALQALQSARTQQGNADGAHREALRRVDTLAAQLSALEGEQQASLFGGVRAVVSAAGAGRLDGYVGTVAELLRVPAELEVAIEAALGGRLQDVVVESWAVAERAIAMLKHAGSGRATFLPLDTLRTSAGPRQPVGAGIVGVARDLVQCESRVSAVAEALLGRLLIVEDLASARKTIRMMQAGSPWTLATLDGEVVRPGGSVTGGSNTRADDQRARSRTILARERRRRELAAALEGARTEASEKEEALQVAITAVRSHENALSEAQRELEVARRLVAAAQMAHMEQQTAVSRLNQEMAWRTGLLHEARDASGNLARTAAGLWAEARSLESEVAPQRASAETSAVALAALRSEREELARGAVENRTRLAVLAEAARNARARVAEAERAIEQLGARARSLTSRLSDSERERTALAQELERHASAAGSLATELATVESQIGPAEQEVREYEAAVGKLEAEYAGLQSLLLENETRHSRAAVERQRCLGALDSLRVEMTEELGPDFAERPAVHGVSPDEQNTLEASAERERRVYALRARLSRLGPVNPLATEEHAELSARHAYLQGQLVDLIKAADSLKHVIAELDRTMREQFATTFAQVNDAFQHFFTTLFGGGTARLELTDPQNVGASGVEIFAQPPGKRMQPLAALSGGERALTSAALLFALLRVRPVPFCVLDEVDAALDESNVTRFRSALEDLGKRTQFIVITHNRGTIEAADTLYGVSMAGDGTSQLLSLKATATASA